MREGWEIKKLGEVCEMIKRGVAPKYTEENGLVVVNQKCIRNHEVNLSLARLHDVSLKKVNPERIIKLGDVLVNSTGTGTLGRVAQVKKDIIAEFTVDTHVTIVRPIPKLFYNDFFGYCLIKIEEEITKSGEGASGQTELSRIKLENDFEVSFPKSLQEQKQIVALLDKAFTAIDQAKANISTNIENAKELFQSKLNDIFSQKGDGWEEKTLGELGTLTSSKRIYKKEYVSKGIPFYRSKEIKELAHKRDITLELFITKERYNEIKSRFGIPQEGDILLTAVGTIGEMYVVKNNEPDFYFKDGNIMWLKNFSTLNSYYLKYALLCFVEQLKAMSQGSAYSALTIEKLKKYSISVPSIDEQVKIVKQLDKLLNFQRTIENNYTKKLKDLEELKKSILQKAFAGELTNQSVVGSN